MPDLASPPPVAAATGAVAPADLYAPRARPCPEISGASLKRQRAMLAVWLAVVDAAALAAAFRLAYWLRFDLQITVAPEVVGRLTDYDGLATLLIPIWMLMLVAFNLYDPQAKLGGIQESSRAFHASTTAAMLVVVATFFVPQFVISRMWLVSVWLLSFLLVAAGRFANRRLLYALRRRGYLLSPALIVGTNEEARSLAGFLGDWQASGVQTLGFVRTGGAGTDVSAAGQVLGTMADLPDLIRRHRVEDVIVAITSLPREELLALCEAVEALPVRLRLSSGLYELLTTRVEVRTLGTVPLMSLQKTRLDAAEALVKRLLDGTLAGVGLLLISPLLLGIAVLVRLDSPGPVLHRRRVLGVFGRPFDALKFRTMYRDADARLRHDPVVAEALRLGRKVPHDPRITRVGRWLRRYSLDELPQLWNVLRGQMSLVGPRMISPGEVTHYGRQRMTLLTVKPGMTGLWQVSGRSDLAYEDRVRIDMYYIRNYSVWLDLQILFIQTPPAVLHGRGAY
ncbi:MAG: sugar transferase [Vicinamibacterales bacterium]